MKNEQFFEAQRLIYLSLAYCTGKRKLDSSMDESNILMQKFHSDLDFKALVYSGIAAFELQLLGSHENFLHLSSSNKDSLFALTASDYGRTINRPRNRNADYLVVHAAIASAIFNEEDDLDKDPSDLGAITVQDVIATLKKSIDSIVAKEDDLVHKELKSAAKRLSELPEVNEENRKSDSLEALIRAVLEHLVSSHYMKREQEGIFEEEFRPTELYRDAIKQTAVETFTSICAFLETRG